ncbi:MAG TPA: hypothetical protein VJV77_07785 [Casimicrobiaceae bacterium]|nr:hypothetical protein [Casimicrobiaceae bacterium]
MVETSRSIFAFLLVLFAASAAAADAGIYTIVDGDVRVLRETAWFRLVPGARARDGDIVEAINEHSQVQLEWTGGGAMNLQGPALVHTGALVAADNKSGAAELVVRRGWIKAAAGKRVMRLRLPNATLEFVDAIVVARGDAEHSELFVESGSAKFVPVAARGKPTAPLEAKSGEYLERVGERVAVAQPRPPQAFVAALPRQFRDALPVLAANFSEEPEVVRGREITLAEAEPWLAPGASRRTFVRRFTPRLSDPAFRAGVNARITAYPEWDRVLHPEKYRPKETSAVK